MSGSEVAGLVRYDDASLDGLRSLSAMAESEDYAPAGRASGGEKLAEWELRAATKRPDPPRSFDGPRLATTLRSSTTASDRDQC